MELRPGYKQTEIGVIPDDWDAVPLAELFTFKNGLNKAKRFFGHGTPIVNYMDVFRHPGLRLHNVKGRVAVSKAELQSFEVRKGDVFFTRTSETVEEIGQAAAMLEQPSQTVFSGFVLRARPIADRLDDAFKAYCFSPRYFREQVIARATYTTRALTNGRALSASKLAVPPLPEQRAIAEALADVDAAIEALDELIAKKRDLRTAAMQSLLTGQGRLPGFSTSWQSVRIGDVATCYSGGTPLTSVPSYYDGDIPWITSADLNQGFITDVTGRISENGLKHSSAKLVSENTLLLAMYGATAGIAAITKIRSAINQAVLAVEPKGQDTLFMFYLLQKKYKDLKESYVQGGQPNLSGKIIKNYALSLPQIDEQQAISSVLLDMDREVQVLIDKLGKTRAIKEALMQALLTGRVRLPVADVERADEEPAHA